MPCVKYHIVLLRNDSPERIVIIKNSPEYKPPVSRTVGKIWPPTPIKMSSGRLRNWNLKMQVKWTVCAN